MKKITFPYRGLPRVKRWLALLSFACTSPVLLANSNPDADRGSLAYCTPAASSTIRFIKDFSTTGGFPNIYNANTGIGTGGYANHTDKKVSQSVGGTINFSTVYSGGNFGLAIWIDWNNNETFEPAEMMLATAAVAASHTGTITIPTGTPVGNYRMRVLADYNTAVPSNPCSFNAANTSGEAEDYTFEVIAPPSCLPATALGASNVTLTAAQLTWTSEGTSFDVEYGPSGFTQGTGTMATSVGNTYNASGLTPDTWYQFYIRSNCGTGDKSPWAGPFRFYTGYCLPSTTTTGYFINRFTTTGGYTNINNTGTTLGAGGYSNYAAQKVSYFENASVSFSAAYTSGCGFAIWIDWNNNMLFDTGERVFNTTASGAAATGTITVPAGTPVGNYRMRIRIDGNNTNPADPCNFATLGRGEAEDYTFEIVAAPSCRPPTNLGAGNLTFTTAQLSWTGSGTVFDIEYGPAGFAQGTGTMISSVGNPYNTTGLTPETSYHYYVRMDCGVNGKSTWVGPFRFYTGYCLPVATVATSYIKDFSTTGGGSNISNLNTGQGTSGYANHTAMTVSQYEGASVNFSAVYNSATLGLAIWIDWNNNMIFDTGERVFNTTALAASATGTITVPAGTPLGSYRMRVLADRNSNNPNNPCSFFAANGSGEAEDYTFVVVAPPSCRPPTNLGAGNLTFTTAQISWTASGTLFDVEYGPAGFTQGTGTMVSSVGNPYNATGLTPETSYQYYVRMDCGAGDKSTWTGPFRFYTGYCLPVATVATNYIKDFSTTGGGSNISNLNTSQGTGGYVNHTAMIVSQYGDASVNFSAVYNSGSHGLAIWIDWNKNLIFDTTERVFNTTASASSVTGTITVPLGTPLGSYRMRVLADYNSNNPNNPCGFSTANGRGEVEDYTFEVTATPSCLPPRTLAASVTTTTAQLSWASSGTLFDIEYGARGFVQGSGTLATGIVNPHPISGLTANRPYQFYVRNDCGAGDKSTWAGPFSFTTACGIETVPYLMDFNEAVVPALPLCTSIQNAGTGNNWNVANITSQWGSKVLNYRYHAAGNPANAWFFTNGIQLEAGINYVLKFQYGNSSGASFVESMKASIGTAADYNAMTRNLVDYPSITNNTPLESSTPFTVETSGVYYLGFNAYSIAERASLYVDNIAVDVIPPPVCVAPTELGAGNITFTGAQLSWQGEGTVFDIEYGPAGFAQGTGTVVSSVGNPYAISGLTPDTSYHYYVRKDCGSGNKSTWAGPFRFYTGYCTPVAASAGYFIKDFTTTGGFTNITNLNTGQGTGGYANHTAMAVSQQEGASVNFRATYNGDFGFAIWIDWNKNMIFEPSERMFRSRMYALSHTGTITIPAGTAVGSYRMRILADLDTIEPENPCRFYNTAGSGEAEDYTFEVATPPACMPPSDLGIGNPTSTGAQFSWLGEGTVFDVEYGPAGFTQGTGTMASAVGNPYNATGLTPDTSYQFYVRKDCGAGNKSSWAGPFRFYTGYCLPVATSTRYFINSFTTTGGFANINNTGTTIGTGGYSNYAAQKVSSYEGGSVSFSAAYTDESGFAIWIDWNNNMAFETSERVFNTTNWGASATGTITVPAATPLGSYKMRIRMDYNNSSPSDACTFASGNGEAEDYTFEVVAPPTCLPPTELGAGNVSYTTAQFSWLGEGTVFDVEYGPAGFTQGTGTMASSIANPYNAAALTPNTAYQFYVRRDCGAEDKSPWAGPFAFFTGPCRPTAPTTTNYFINNFTTTGGLLNINNLGTGSGAGGYSNFAALKVRQLTGASINFSAAYSAGSGFAIWIDWNSNMAFEASERVFTTTAYGDAATGTITVPAGTASGSYIMRIMADYNDNDPNDPCAFFLYEDEFEEAYSGGEAEDYTFEVTSPPTCTPPSDLAIGNLTFTGAQFSWQSEGTLFDVEYGPAGFAQGTGTMASAVANPYNATGLTPDTAYQFYVRRDCGTGNKSVWAGPFRFLTGYCTPAAIATSHFISSFTTTGGAANISNTGTTIGAGGYSNFTAMKVRHFAGGSINFSAAYSNDSGFAIWVDWNNNMAFEPAERLFATTDFGSSATGSLTVPAGTPVGNYRMRILMDNNADSPSDPCNFGFGYGEAEDYTFEVVAPPTCLPPTELGAGNITFTAAQLSWMSEGTVFDVEYGPAGFTQGTGTMASAVANPYNVTALTPDTAYQFYVRRDCGAGDKSPWAGPFRFYTGYCLPVASGTSNYIKDFSTTGGTTNITNLNTNQGMGGYANHTTMIVTQFYSASINFSAVNNNSVVGGLSIWIDWDRNMAFEVSERMFQSTGYRSTHTGTIMVPTGIPPGSYRMRVLSDFDQENPDNPCGFDSGNGEAEDYTLKVEEPLSVPELGASAFRAYPNPVKDLLYLASSQEITDAAVFNMVGQQVIAKQIRNSKGQIDLSALPSGTYLVKARTADNSTKMIKVIKQ